MIVVVNPVAGGGRAGRTWPRVADHLRAAGLKFETLTTESPGDGSRLAAKVGDGASLVVAGGGDGTVNEVLNGLLAVPAARRPCLGILPMGTGTDACRGLGIPLDLFRAATTLQTGVRRRVDAGLVTCAGSDGPVRRYFLNIADAGIGGDVADFVNSGFKVGNGAVTFSLAAVITLMRWRNPRLRLDLDGDILEVTAQQVVIANCQYYGGGMRIAPQARPDDGLFDVVINGDLGRIETMRLLGNVRNGSHMAHPKIQHHLARRVAVTGPSTVGVDADGERPGQLPAVFEVVPGAVEVMVPRS